MFTDKLVKTGMFASLADALTGHVASALTAAGNSQATALQLIQDINLVGTTAASTGVVLPLNLKSGDRTFVFNGGANSLAVYPPLGGTINGGSANASVAVAAGTGVEFICQGDGLTFYVAAGVGASTLASLAVTGNATVGGTLTLSGLASMLAANTITAHAGGGQALATALTAQFNRVTTVATAGDSVVLPAATAGLMITIYNDGANPLAVFPAGTDAINDAGASASITQMPNSLYTFVCGAAGMWECEAVGSGFAGNFPTLSTTNNITAAATQTQAAATVLTTCLNRVVTVATAGNGVALPAAIAGMQITVINAHATNAINVYPVNGGTDAINALAANGAYSLAATKTAIFTCAVTGQWHSVLSA